MNVQIETPVLLAKIRDQGAKIAELELVRDAYDAALGQANARIAELEAQFADEPEQPVEETP